MFYYCIAKYISSLYKTQALVDRGLYACVLCTLYRRNTSLNLTINIDIHSSISTHWHKSLGATNTIDFTAFECVALFIICDFEISL